MSAEIENEIEVMTQIYNLILPLTAEARNRVLSWLDARNEEINKTPAERLKSLKFQRQQFFNRLGEIETTINNLES